MKYIDLSTGKELAANDPRGLATKEERIAAAQAEQAAFVANLAAFAQLNAPREVNFLTGAPTIQNSTP